MQMTEEERKEKKQNQELFQSIVQAFETADVEKTREYINDLIQKRANNPQIRLTIKVLSQLFDAATDRKYLLFEIIESLGTPYSIEVLRSYPQSTINPRCEVCLTKLLSLDLFTDEIVKIFLNTVLREKITLNYLMKGLEENKGIDESEIIKALSDYWFIGEVKRISDDGYLRIAPQNVGMSRLAGVYTSTYKISADDGHFVDPFVGQILYFKILKYNKTTDLFTVHYLCTNPSTIEKKWNEKSKIL